MGNRDGHASPAIGGQRAATVEPEPADPQHGGTYHHHAGIMRRDNLTRKPATAAEHDGDNKCRYARRQVNH